MLPINLTVAPPRTILQYVSGGSLLVFGGWTLLQQLRKIGGDYVTSRKKQKLLEMYAKRSLERADIVILHQFQSSERIPNPSGFAIKLETFLRLGNIQYEIDTDMPKGENEKGPWITLNGEHYSDSQLIIHMLQTKLELQFGNYNLEERGIATAARIMMEEHFYWGLILWRYVYSGGSYLDQLFPLKGRQLAEFRSICREKYLAFTWGQGLGRLAQNDVISLMILDLEAISALLGEKSYLLGEHPCSDDCAVFGILAQVLWADLGSPFDNYISEKLPNLQEYCVRMKETFWPDWEAAKGDTFRSGREISPQPQP